MDVVGDSNIVNFSLLVTILSYYTKNWNLCSDTSKHWFAKHKTVEARKLNGCIIPLTPFMIRLFAIYEENVSATET
jgi:hypothetical protein